MTKQHIDRLKELLVTSSDLTEPLDYFLQHVITDPEIVRSSEPAASVAAPQRHRRAGRAPLRGRAGRSGAVLPARARLPALARWLPPRRLRDAPDLLRRRQDRTAVHRAAAGYGQRGLRALLGGRPAHSAGRRTDDRTGSGEDAPILPRRAAVAREGAGLARGRQYTAHAGQSVRLRRVAQ